MPNGRCYMHGGATPAGIASPHYVTGRHSRYLPARLLESYQASLRDPDRLALEAEIAVLDARLSDVLGRVDTGESGQLWERLKATVDQVQAARRVDNPAAVLELLDTLVHLVDGGHADQAAWGEVRALIQERRRLVESERKRQIEMHHVVSVDRFLVLVGALTEAVKQHVTDRQALAAISAEFGRLLAAGRPDTGRARAE